MNKNEIKNITLKYIKKTYPNQNRLRKDTERIFENYIHCRSFKDFSRGLKIGYNLAIERTNNMRTLTEININKELPPELLTVNTDVGECYYSHIHLQWFHAKNNIPFDINETKPHIWYKLIDVGK